MKELLNNIRGRSFLVTGGAGFIGSNLCSFLLEKGAGKVRVLDNLSTGRKINLAPFLNHPAFEFIEADIRDLASCMQSVDGIDSVLHQAALGSVPRSLLDPVMTNSVNVTGFLNMLMAAKEKGLRRFVYAASSSTYGDSPGLPKTEDRIGNPLSPYAVTKYVNELYANVFARCYGLETIGLRYFNVFGRNQDPDGAYAAVIPRFALQLIRHESPLINGDGLHSRDFTYIDNVVQANMLALFTEREEAVNTVYNVAFGEQTTLNELVASLISALTKFDPAIAAIRAIYGPDRAGDIPHSLASIDKARQLLEYDPQVAFKDGLSKAASWYWHQYSQASGQKSADEEKEDSNW